MKKILLTGATGYIGKRMISVILENNYKVVCCTRDVDRFEYPVGVDKSLIEIIEVDFLKVETLTKIPNDIDGAFYLIHSMSSHRDYSNLESICAKNFSAVISNTSCQHVVYLSGIVNSKETSQHLSSRKSVEDILSRGSFDFTTLRAGIIIGSGSASFEIIRDLVEKLPLMVTPKWLHTKCQPIGIANVLDFLIKTIFNPKTYNNYYDIGCDDVLTYKEMLLGYAKVRKLKRWIYTLPIMTPKLSSYWLYFVTSTSYNLASALVESMRIEVVCDKQKLEEIKRITSVKPFSYHQSLERTESKIQAHEIISSWKDSFVSSRSDSNLDQFIEVPKFGVFVDVKSAFFDDKSKCMSRVFSIGGDNGWYAQYLWKWRGFLDQLFGGPGLRRGRRHPTNLNAGDALDFWRVLYADSDRGKLILFAEMKLPGEAWLMFTIKKGKLWQKAVFKPRGLWGRIYWYSVLPFHGIVFSGMVKRLAKGK